MMVKANDIAFVPVLVLFFSSSVWADGSECGDAPLPPAKRLYCNGTLTNSKDNWPVPTLVILDDFCPTGYISWVAPSRSQLLQFSRSDKQSFVVCLTISRPGVAVYQLIGRSKRLLASYESSADDVPCQHSQCGNLPLLLESDAELLQQNSTLPSFTETEDSENNSSILEISYQHFNDCKCPHCTDSCMKHTICKSDYVLVGTVKMSEFINQTQQEKYLNEVEIEDGYIRYNNSYSKQFLHPGVKPSCKLNQSATTAAVMAGQAISSNGSVLIYSGCQLEQDHKYFIGAHLYLNDSISKEPHLMLGCAQESIDYARYHLQDLLRRGQCCS